jgi:uncharacterized protein with FMN-binding domain
MTPATTAPVRLRRLAAVGGGLLSIAALAGCAPSAASDTTAPSTDAAATPSTPSAASTPSAPSSSAAAGLKDGTYSATGDYQSPGGASAIAVTVTLKSGTITAVQVAPKAADATARQYEAQFASGIDAVAVGKPIEGLKVGAVSGSSLTSQGFEKALAAIRSKASA